MPLTVAWETFGEANGTQSYGEMVRRVRALRHSDDADDRVGCVVLADVILLDPTEWIAAPADWKPNIVRGAGYDLSLGEGARVWNQLRVLAATTPRQSPTLSVSGGFGPAALVTPRRGQGAFRLMVMDAYDRRCAVTGERTLPALEAAHIRPYSEHQKHEVRNGILMRSDLHRLYDLGLVTVKPDFTFHVSRTIERDYANGKIYYALEGTTISTPPHVDAKPDTDALAWHAEQKFRP
jgi:putative restriction endonuclease